MIKNKNWLHIFLLIGSLVSGAFYVISLYIWPGFTANQTFLRLMSAIYVLLMAAWAFNAFPFSLIWSLKFEYIIIIEFVSCCLSVLFLVLSGTQLPQLTQKTLNVEGVEGFIYSVLALVFSILFVIASNSNLRLIKNNIIIIYMKGIGVVISRGCFVGSCVFLTKYLLSYFGVLIYLSQKYTP